MAKIKELTPPNDGENVEHRNFCGSIEKYNQFRKSSSSFLWNLKHSPTYNPILFFSQEQWKHAQRATV